MDEISHRKPDSRVSLIQVLKSLTTITTMRLAGIALLYLFIAWAIHAGTINPFTHLIGGGDGFTQGIASKSFATSFCPWNPYIQSGKFVYADVLYQSFYPLNLIISSLFPHTFGFNLFLLVHYALAGLFVYLYLGSLRLTNYSAFIGGLIFMGCGFMSGHKCHEYILCAAVWLPLTLHFIHRYAERLRILDLGYAAVPVALSILAGFPQITLYSALLVAAYIPFCVAGSALLQSWKTKLAHIVFAEVVVLGLGCLLGCLPLFSVAASLPSFTRERITYGMFTSDNFPPWQLFTLVIPNLFGGINRHIPAYAPDTTVFVAEVYTYIGILPLALTLVAIFGRRTACRELKMWVTIAVIALLVSLGGMTPVYFLLFHVPVINLFRVPARNLFEVDLALSVIAAIGLDLLLAKSKAATIDFIRVVRLTLVGISILNGVAILAAVVLRFVAEGRFAPFFTIPDSIQLNYDYTFGAAKRAMIRNLSWNSPTLEMPLLFFILSVGILLLLVRMRLRTAGMIAIPVLIVADTFSAARRLYDNPSTELLYGSAGRPELDFLRSRHFDREHYRLFPVDFDLGSMTRLTSTYHLTTIYPYPLLNMFSSLPVINDYGPFWVKRYQAVTGFSATGTMPVANLQNYKMLSVLGARYLMALSSESRRAIEEAMLDSTTGKAALKAFSAVAVTPDGITIFENPSALPRFRFVRRVISAQDLDNALSLMNQPGFNPAEEAIVEGIADDGQTWPSRIISEKLAATRLKWEVETAGRSFFVAADSLFPGWTATVDRRTVPIYAVYGCVRGILIETAGRHRVEMRFAPPGLEAGLACTGIGLLLLGMLWLSDRT
ncbi:MAG: hypothetical protein JO066_12655, partial [Verrucomicrobia bacterium]|nr:hypothetical protein [Verrucomicrobiota bacterium]